MASLGERIKEYSTTSKGKIVVVAAPTAALVLVVAVVFLFVLKGGGSAGEQAAGQGAEVTVAATGVSEATGSTETSTGLDSTATPDSVSEPPVNLDLEVYETRDPFKPADTTASSSVNVNTSTGLVSTSTAGTKTVSNTAAQSQTLTLKSISDQNGVLYANIDYGESSYMVRAGERVGKSPYQVTAVTTQGATLLFGDDNVTLDVGDQVTK